MNFNITSMAYLYWSGLSNSQACINSISILIFIYKHYLKQLCKVLKNMIGQFSNKNSIYYRLYIAYKFDHFTKQHIEIVNMVEKMDQLVSKAYSTSVLTSICFTCYMFTLILFKNLNYMTKIAVICLCIVNFIGAVVASFPLIELTKLIHDYGKYLVPIQLFMHSKLVAHKLKLNLYFELINSFKKITFFVSPLGGVTSYSLIKVKNILFLL